MKINTRKRVLLLRNSLENQEYVELSALIQANLFNLEEYKKAKTVLFYYAFGSEVLTQKMIQDSLKEKIVLLPKVNNSKKTFTAHQIKNCHKDLSEGFSGIQEPNETCQEYAKNKIDLIVVPGVAFGTKGERLGYGTGFYDRFLKGCTGAFVGICFEIQITDKIVPDEHDVKMHKIVTEKRVIDCQI